MTSIRVKKKRRSEYTMLLLVALRRKRAKYGKKPLKARVNPLKGYDFRGRISI